MNWRVNKWVGGNWLITFAEQTIEQRCEQRGIQGFGAAQAAVSLGWEEGQWKACRLVRTKACHLLLLFVGCVVLFFFPRLICMSRWLDDLPTHSIVKKWNTAGGERVSKAQASSATDHGNEKGAEKNHDGFDVNLQQTAAVPYRDPCWAQPTTAWTCPDGTLPSRSWPGCQTCSGRPCGPPTGWQAAGGAVSAVCGGRHAHLLHLEERLGVKTEACESHPGTETKDKSDSASQRP